MSDREEAARHAFISYVREDSDDVDQLQRVLEVAGIRVWRDTVDLWPGEDWRARIRHAITGNALAFIACFSSRSLGREVSYQNEELALAIEQLRLRRPDVPWLIPVRFDDCRIPDLDIGGGRTLASIQRVDVFRERFDEGAARLAAAVLRILGRYSDSDPAASWIRSVLAGSGSDIVPIYLVCNETASMAGSPIQAVNDMVPRLYVQVASSPVAESRARLGTIGFADDAEVILPLSDLRFMRSVPAFQARGNGRSFGAAFKLLREAIEHDVGRLETLRRSTVRPIVLFLVDGEPTDGDWRSAYARIVDPTWRARPNIIVFGFGKVSPSTCREIATSPEFALIRDAAKGPAEMLREYMGLLDQVLML